MAELRWDYAGMGEFLRSAGMQAEMLRRAEKVKRLAEATAPVDVHGPHPGRYKAAFRVESERRHDRAVARVINDAPEAVYVEFGNKNTPRHATLRRALDAAKE